MQHVEEHVAIVVIGGILGAGAVFQKDMAIHPQLGGTGRGLACVVRLRGPLGDHQIGALFQRFRHQEFELAGLVAAGGHAGAVIALDPDPRSAQFR